MDNQAGYVRKVILFLKSISSLYFRIKSIAKISLSAFPQTLPFIAGNIYARKLNVKLSTGQQIFEFAS